MTKQPLNFVPEVYCKNCGQCCAELVGRGHWNGNRLTGKQRKAVSDKIKTLVGLDRAKYDGKKLREKDGCAAVHWENGKSYCLVREMYGVEVLQPECIDYPFGKLCLRQEKENG